MPEELISCLLDDTCPEKFEDTKEHSEVHFALRLGCAGLVFAFNAAMWTFFAKALRYSSSSAAATVTTTASNFVSSAVLGKVLFGESRAILWWVGISITLCGLVLLHTSSSRTEDTTKKES
ncbi:unnamed protein product [Ranitomeya imitator]|uniref:EamA domain-containing protein n=1 Tax=Ranitomeya imitator TaxID=111125 RepID=A0ABN9MI18_9NEOB|nr:unnamed protein product [Ranitomeya imitator]